MAAIITNPKLSSIEEKVECIRILRDKFGVSAEGVGKCCDIRRTPMSGAVFTGDRELVRALVQAGFSVNLEVARENGIRLSCVPLYVAVQRRDVRMLRQLIDEHGAALSLSNRTLVRNCCAVAIANDDLAMLRVLKEEYNAGRLPSSRPDGAPVLPSGSALRTRFYSTLYCNEVHCSANPPILVGADIQCVGEQLVQDFALSVPLFQRLV